MSPAPRIVPVYGEHGTLLYRLHYAPEFRQPDGILRVWETAHLGWAPQRWFTIHDAAGYVRADHAHMECAELLIPTVGAAEIVVRAPSGESFQGPLRVGGPAIEIPARRWVRIVDIAPGTVFVVGASHAYNPMGYITDPEIFAACAP